jgi:hypothetical protein
VRVLASYPGERGVVVRLLNAADRPVEASLRLGVPAREAVAVDPLEQPLPVTQVRLDGDRLSLPLRPWELATILLRS